MNPIPAGDELELRPLTAPAAATLGRDRAAAAALLGASLPPDWPGPDLAEILPLLAAAGPSTAGFGAWIIVERATATVVGDAGFIGPPDAAGVVEIGYSVLPDRRRRGYATAAVSALLGWATAQARVRGVVARCDPDNTASIRVLEATGFRRTGKAEGQLTWAAGDAGPHGQQARAASRTPTAGRRQSEPRTS
ncbi:MAG: GNAT family N-acetyltransferase [Chloroflexi bacterium]|nr:GNAT family N-acetyltransferase [Chloroflexota bacterium]